MKNEDIINNLIDILKKLEKKENYYEMFNMFFISQNILNKNNFIEILNRLEKKTKKEILFKMINVNNFKFYEEDNSILKLRKENFNAQLIKFIKEINFLF